MWSHDSNKNQLSKKESYFWHTWVCGLKIYIHTTYFRDFFFKKMRLRINILPKFTQLLSSKSRIKT